MTRYGPRTVDGYQFPATDAMPGPLQRRAPVLASGPIGAWRASCALVPLAGGRPNLFSVEAVWSGPDGAAGAISCLLQGEPARAAYLRLVEHFRAGHGPPDAVPVEPGTPLL